MIYLRNVYSSDVMVRDVYPYSVLDWILEEIEYNMKEMPTILL